MHHRLPTFLTAVLAVTLSCSPSAAWPAPSTDAYRGVLQMVENGGEWERHDFARIALHAMASEHEEVLGLAREDAPGDVETKKMRRWMAATMPYLESLYAALDAVDLADGVDVAIGNEGTVQVTVGEHFVVVSALDIAHPARLENAIVDEFCQLHDCDFAFERTIDVPPGRWEFSQDAGSGYATRAGVRCLFSSAESKAHKERVCRELGDALAALLKRLRHWQASGIGIDWPAFEVIVDGPATLSLRLNNRGDWLMIDDPTLARLPDVLELAGPWLLARLEGGDAELVIPHAELLLEPAFAR